MKQALFRIENNAYVYWVGDLISFDKMVPSVLSKTAGYIMKHAVEDAENNI